MNTWMRGFLFAAAGAAFLAAPHGAEAQMGISGEGRLGVTFPTGDLSDAGAEAGLGMGAELLFTFQPNLSAYVGLNRHGFACEGGCEDALGENLRSTGVGAGLKFVFPSPRDALVWARGGIVAHKLSSDEGSSSRNIGFEVGTGIDMPVAPRLYLTPHLGLVSHDGGGDLTATYFNFGLGLHYHFR
jgi:hypothetical protein